MAFFSDNLLKFIIRSASTPPDLAQQGHLWPGFWKKRKIIYMKKSLFFFGFYLITFQIIAQEQAKPHYLDRHKPVVIWTLDQDPAAGNFTDTSGTYKGNIHNNKGQLPKLINGARDFTGKAWDFSKTPAALRTDATNRITTIGDTENTKGVSLSYWMKMHKDKLQPNRNNRLFGHPAFEATLTGIGYGACNFNFGKQYKISFPGKTGPTHQAFDGNWHHVAVTVDFNSTRGNLVLYLDGKEVNRVSGAANVKFNTDHPRTNFFIGARRNGGNSCPMPLDDVAVFDYPLTQQQVLEIYNGPVYAGNNIVVYMPDKTRLQGISPKGKKVKWSKLAGPGNIKFANPNSPTTEIKFDQAGDYKLKFAVSGHQAQTLEIKVHPPTPPQVYAGNPILVKSTKDSAKLEAQVSVPGRKEGDLQGVTLNWEKVSGPGQVTFSDKAIQNPKVSFDQDGLYQLKLTATKDGLSNSDLLSVMVGERKEPHYGLLLNPLYLISMDTPASTASAGVVEEAGTTCAELKGNLKTLPKMESGARPFTGNAWNFAGADCKVAVHNRFNISRIGRLSSTKGFALSLWLKGDKYGNHLGRIGGFGKFEMGPHKYSQGVQVNTAGPSLHTPIKPKIPFWDNQWHHVVVTGDLNSKENNVKLYVDGKLVDQKSHHYTEKFSSDRPDHTHNWGCRGNGAGHWFGGQIDDIMAFDRALTEEEVAYLFNGPTAEQQAQLKATKPEVNAGSDQLYRLPVKEVTLRGKAKGSSNLKYQWQMVTGPSTVTFSDPNAPTTRVTFGKLSKNHHNPNYRQYIFRLTARDGEGKIAREAGDEVSVVFYNNKVPATRKLTATPKPGVHPRLFFTNEDLPEMRQRVASDPYAQEGLKNLKGHLAGGLFNPKTPMGAAYQDLKDGKKDVDVRFVITSGRGYWSGKGGMYSALAGAAMISLLENDEAKLKELATVLSRAANEHLKYYRPNYVNKLTHDADGGAAMAYDFLASYMDEEQKKPIRKVLSKMSKWRQTLGSATEEHRNNSTNWFTHHDFIALCAMAIEGEEGDDPEMIEQAKHKLRTFTSQHGVYPSGYAHEGWVYYRMGMESGALAALALSRRGENLYETTNFYPSAITMFRNMPPRESWIAGFNDGGPQCRAMQPLDWVMRYLWPDDPAVATLYGKRLKMLYDNRINNKKDAGQFHLMALIFAVGSQPLGSQKAAATKLKLPQDAFCPDKGYVNMRSSWGDDAVNLMFRCRQDKYSLGHQHSDVNTFELYHNGTTWFQDFGKYTNKNDNHQTVLIDGLGGNNSSNMTNWPSTPGHLLEVKHDGNMVLGAGDAWTFYNYAQSGPNPKIPGIKVKKVNHKVMDKLWADYVYGKTRADLASMPDWRAKPMQIGHGSLDPFIYNPVQRAFRTAALVKGNNPFVLIVDDIQKDNKKRRYDWVGNLQNGSVEVVSQSGKDLILKKKGDEDIGNLLLVRVLEADGKGGKPQLINGTPDNTKHIGKVTQVRVTVKDTVAPNYKILLYPHKKGAPLPKTSLKGNKLTVQWDDQKDTIEFKKDAKGRTHLKKL